MVLLLSLRAFYASNPQGARHFLMDRRRGKTLPAPAKSQRRIFWGNAFCRSFSLDVGRPDQGVVYSGDVLPGDFSPVRFSDFKESLANFSAPTTESSGRKDTFPF
jgi:hypothetical protein